MWHASYNNDKSNCLQWRYNVCVCIVHVGLSDTAKSCSYIYYHAMQPSIQQWVFDNLQIYYFISNQLQGLCPQHPGGNPFWKIPNHTCNYISQIFLWLIVTPVLWAHVLAAIIPLCHYSIWVCKLLLQELSLDIYIKL